MARDHHKFDSTRVSEAWYDRDRREITVRFPDGVRWVYREVRYPVWLDFIDATSPGRFLNEVLTNKYPNRVAN